MTVTISRFNSPLADFFESTNPNKDDTCKSGRTARTEKTEKRSFVTSFPTEPPTRRPRVTEICWRIFCLTLMLVVECLFTFDSQILLRSMCGLQEVTATRYHKACAILIHSMAVVFNILIGRRPMSKMEREMNNYIILVWMCVMFRGLAHIMELCPQNMMETISVVLSCSLISPLMTHAFLGLMVHRIVLLEMSFGRSLSAWSMNVIRRICLALILLLLCTFILSRECVLHNSCELVEISGISVRMIATIAIGVMSLRAISIVKRALPLDLPTGSYVQGEAAWARRVLSKLACVMCFSCAYNVFMSMILIHLRLHLYVHQEEMEADEMIPVVETTQCAVEVLCLVCFVGFFKAQKPDIDICTQQPPMASITLRNRSAAWRKKVEDLGRRSIDVMSLLSLWKRLQAKDDLMPFFDPRLSTTNDVVRQAIIPLSRDGGMNIAGCVVEGIDSGKPYCFNLDDGDTLPDVMVTHTWSSLFLHLVAAVVADALGHRDYEDVTKMLLHQRFDIIEAKLIERGTSCLRYWICTCCVNQHASICHTPGPQPEIINGAYHRWDANRRDSITHEVFEWCDCSHPKFCNDICPDECEMNKFDDMMVFLQEVVPHFRQMVVVDPEVDLFGRAWCVAELVQGHLLGTPQHLQMLSSRLLDVQSNDLRIYAKLVTMSVADCEASRSEDKAEILRKIPDVKLFDSHLQGIIFGDRGLLSRQLLGFDLVEAAGHSARRLSEVFAHPKASESCTVIV